MTESSKQKKRAKIAKKHANILMPKVNKKSDNGGNDDDELENDVDNYEDSRIELKASGHNLVSDYCLNSSTHSLTLPTTHLRTTLSFHYQL